MIGINVGSRGGLYIFEFPYMDLFIFDLVVFDVTEAHRCDTGPELEFRFVSPHSSDYDPSFRRSV